MTVSYDRLNTRCRDKYGIASTYTPDGGTGRAVVVIVDRDYFAETGGQGIQTEKLIIQAVSSDIPEIATGDLFDFAAADLTGTYKVAEAKPDFYGMIDLALNKV